MIQRQRIYKSTKTLFPYTTLFRSKTWQFACREEHIPEVGDYHVYDLGTYSFIITRVAADDIRAYYNACLHRGTKLRASGTEGNTEEFKCTFHGWTWNLDGSHKETLCDWDFPHVDFKNLTLPQVRETGRASVGEKVGQHV